MFGFQFLNCTVLTGLVLSPAVESELAIESLKLAVSIYCYA